MNKNKGPKKPMAAATSVTQRDQVPIKFGGSLTAGARDTERLIKKDDPLHVAASWSDEQLRLAVEAIPEGTRSEGQINLLRVADFCKKLVKAAAKLEQLETEALDVLTREGDVTRQEQWLAGERSKLEEDTKSIQERKEKVSLIEGAANTGFAEMRAEVERELAALRSNFESEKAEKVAALEQEVNSRSANKIQELALRDQSISAREESVLAAEDKARQNEASLAVKRRRIERREEELEQARTDAITEAKQIASDEVEAERQRRRNAEEKARRAAEEFTKAISDLDHFSELSRALAGRKPEVILGDLKSLREECDQLRDELASRPNDVGGDTSKIRKEKEALQVVLGQVQAELERTKSELSKIRVGAVERDGLEKQKFALEKTNQALAAKLNQLGETVDKLSDAGRTKASFPELVRMDADDKLQSARRLEEVKDLRKFAEDLRHRIATAEPDVPLYYELRDVRLLVAGLATSQLHIFQGISGTGKTSLAKAFAKAVGGHCEDIAVQAGWRDKDDLLGHYNPFDKRFAEKPCLKGLYRAQTPRYSDSCNVVLLDEMNLSHPEQYFADFLSALEKNSLDDRLIELYESALDNPPALLRLGRSICVPENVWFIGTANHDETTKGFADKTVDRAHVMTLPRHEAKFSVNQTPRHLGYSWNSLKTCFDAVKSKRRGVVDQMLDELSTGPMIKVLEEQFRVGLGNRFDRQARSFLPVFEAAGGDMSHALDHLLASKAFRSGKATGRYDTNKANLEALQKALKQTWKGISSGEPTQCLSLIEADLQSKSRT